MFGVPGRAEMPHVFHVRKSQSFHKSNMLVSPEGPGTGMDTPILQPNKPILDSCTMFQGQGSDNLGGKNGATPAPSTSLIGQ